MGEIATDTDRVAEVARNLIYEGCLELEFLVDEEDEGDEHWIWRP